MGMRLGVVVGAVTATVLLAGCGSGSGTAAKVPADALPPTPSTAPCKAVETYLSRLASLEQGQINLRASQVAGFAGGLTKQLDAMQQASPAGIASDIASAKQVWTLTVRYLRQQAHPSLRQVQTEVAKRVPNAATDGRAMEAYWTHRCHVSPQGRPAHSVLCEGWNAAVWLNGYLGGKYGGGPQEDSATAAGIGAADVYQIEQVVPKAEKPEVKAIYTTWADANAFYNNREAAGEGWTRKAYERNVPSSKKQWFAFNAWAKPQCAVPGKPWPTKPAEAKKQGL